MNTDKQKKAHLPFPTGPFATGSMELMTEYSSEGCFARIFYPTNIPSDQLDKYSDKWIQWMPDTMYYRAFAHALSIPYFILKYGQFVIGQETYYIPTISDAPLSDREQSYPLIIFSHGYAATRFVCSNYCNTLASYGYIVAAIEHRDESSPITYYYDSPESAEKDNRTYIDHLHFHKWYGSDNYTSKNAQMKIRHKECTKLLNTFFDLNSGISVKNVLKSQFDISQFKNKIDTSNIVASGFSFGGCTTLYNVYHDNRYRAAVILDSWMFPLKSEPISNIQQPILSINTHTFQIPPNSNLIRKFLCTKGIRQIYTLKKTTHESPTDTPYMFGHWLDLLMLKKMDAETALNLHSGLTIKFLRDTIGYPKNCDDAQIYIKEHDDDLIEDIICYNNKPQKKIGIFPW